MRPITKWSVAIPSTDRIQEYVDSAFRVAQANVPGPVFLEIPLDLLMSWADDAPPVTAPMAPSRPGGDPALIARAAQMLRESERPMFIVGSQLRWSPRREVLASFAEAVQAPYYLNGMARGALPHGHPSLMTRSRKFALGQTDLCFVFGTPFDFRLEYGRAIHPGAKVVQIDLDGNELGKNRRLDLAIDGDSGVVLEQLLVEVKGKRAEAWLAAVRAAEDKARAKMAAEIESSASPPNPLRVCAEIGKRLGRNDIVIGDGGDFVATAAYVLKLEWPQLWMDPGPLGTLGVGPGYAMAAKLARPEGNVVLVYGDGSFGLHAMEFEAMIRQQIPVVAVIGNDAAWTQIRRGQVELYGPARAPATALDYSRYDKVVEALGGFGAYVEKVEELGPALDAAFAAGKPACVNVKIAGSDFRKGAISV
jgi:acetolactate synthase-1/2/3 large subunit